MTSDYPRLITERLLAANADSEAAREAIFEACRQKVASSYSDADERARELDRLEKSIRRHRVQGHYEDGLRAAPLARSDEIYESVRFEHVPSGNLVSGMVGWRNGSERWVMLQVLDGTGTSADGATEQLAYDAAARKMARHGYAAPLSDATFPFEDSADHARRHAKRMSWLRHGLICLAAAVLLLIGIGIGIGVAVR